MNTKWYDYDLVRYQGYTKKTDDGYVIHIFIDNKDIPLHWYGVDFYAEYEIMYIIEDKEYAWVVGLSTMGVDIKPELDGEWIYSGTSKSLSKALKEVKYYSTIINDEIV